MRPVPRHGHGTSPLQVLTATPPMTTRPHTHTHPCTHTHSHTRAYIYIYILYFYRYPSHEADSNWDDDGRRIDDKSYQQMTETACGSCGGKGCHPVGKCSVCGGKGFTMQNQTVTMEIPPGAKQGFQVPGALSLCIYIWSNLTHTYALVGIHVFAYAGGSARVRAQAIEAGWPRGRDGDPSLHHTRRMEVR
jgi:hypothetical protein